MFRKSIILLSSILLCISLFSCAYPNPGTPSSTSSNSYEELLDALEAKLAELQSSYSNENDDTKEEIERLKAEIEKIKNSSSAPTTTQAVTTQATPERISPLVLKKLSR